MMHVLVVTHLFSCVKMEIAGLFLCLHDGRLNRGWCLALKPLVFHLKIRLPSNTNTIPILWWKNELNLGNMSGLVGENVVGKRV